jgi:hypothetical protein
VAPPPHIDEMTNVVVILLQMKCDILRLEEEERRRWKNSEVQHSTHHKIKAKLKTNITNTKAKALYLHVITIISIFVRNNILRLCLLFGRCELLLLLLLLLFRQMDMRIENIINQ